MDADPDHDSFRFAKGLAAFAQAVAAMSGAPAVMEGRAPPGVAGRLFTVS
jgi:hypothetical protein